MVYQILINFETYTFYSTNYIEIKHILNFFNHFVSYTSKTPLHYSCYITNMTTMSNDFALQPLGRKKKKQPKTSTHIGRPLVYPMQKGYSIS